jgi:hypothetical protein
LHLAAEAFGEQFPALPVVFGEAVLDRHDRELIHQLFELPHHFCTGVAATVEGIATVLEEFGAGDVECQGDLFPRFVARFLNCFHQDFAGFHVAEVGGETTFISNGGAHAFGIQQVFQGVEHLGAHSQRFPEAWGAVGNQHELLKIQAVRGMGTAIDHVHQWHRQEIGLAAPPNSGKGANPAHWQRPVPWPCSPPGLSWHRGWTCCRCHPAQALLHRQLLDRVPISRRELGRCVLQCG